MLKYFHIEIFRCVIVRRPSVWNAQRVYWHWALSNAGFTVIHSAARRNGESVVREKCCEGDGDIVFDASLEPPTIDHNSIEDMTALVKAISDPRRYEILTMIAVEPGICSCTILDKLGISQSTLSYHMRILYSSGLVKGYRQGKWLHYTLAANGVEAFLHLALRLRAGLLQGDANS